MRYAQSRLLIECLAFANHLLSRQAVEGHDTKSRVQSTSLAPSRHNRALILLASLARLALLAVLFCQLVTFKPAWISLDQLGSARMRETELNSCTSPRLGRFGNSIALCHPGPP
jgi:hypothetical protein